MLKQMAPGSVLVDIAIDLPEAARELRAVAGRHHVIETNRPRVRRRLRDGVALATAKTLHLEVSPSPELNQMLEDGRVVRV